MHGFIGVQAQGVFINISPPLAWAFGFTVARRDARTRTAAALYRPIARAVRRKGRPAARPDTSAGGAAPAWQAAGARGVQRRAQTPLIRHGLPVARYVRRLDAPCRVARGRAQQPGLRLARIAGRVRAGPGGWAQGRVRTAQGRGAARVKRKEKEQAYSVLNEWPQEQDFVTFGLLILKPEPMRLSM